MPARVRDNWRIVKTNENQPSRITTAKRQVAVIILDPTLLPKITCTRNSGGPNEITLQFIQHMPNIVGGSCDLVMKVTSTRPG